MQKRTRAQKKNDGTLRRLLFLLELLQQALEVKLESLFALPRVLEQSGSREGSPVASIGTELVSHVAALTFLVNDLGGRVGDATLPQSSRTHYDPTAALIFHEELTVQILRECGSVLQRERTSELKGRVEQVLTTVLRETQQHLVLLDRQFTAEQPRYRDLVLQQLRVTALP